MNALASPFVPGSSVMCDEPSRGQTITGTCMDQITCGYEAPGSARRMDIPHPDLA